MYKKIEFYKIDYDFFQMHAHDKSEQELKTILINDIIHSVEPDKQYQIKKDESGSRSVIIEIINITNDYLFGVIGKLEDLKDGILKRFRSKEDGTVIDADERDINLCIENYTYFYVRFSDFICAVLSNQSAPKFRTHFCNFLKDVISVHLLQNLNIVIVFDDNINYKINHITQLSEMKLIFDDTSNMGKELLNLTKTFDLSQSSLKRANISVDFKVNVVTEKTKQMFKKPELLKTDFKKLELIGNDEDENDIQMELVERILTKRVFIDIDEKYLKSSKDLEKIKEILIKAISPI